MEKKKNYKTFLGYISVAAMGVGIALIIEEFIVGLFLMIGGLVIYQINMHKRYR